MTAGEVPRGVWKPRARRRSESQSGAPSSQLVRGVSARALRSERVSALMRRCREGEGNAPKPMAGGFVGRGVEDIHQIASGGRGEGKSDTAVLKIGERFGDASRGNDQFAKLLDAAFLELLCPFGECLQFRINIAGFAHLLSPLRGDAPMIISMISQCCRVVETV